MKLFKNRGDIYISKSDYKSSKEERILLSLLCVVVVFTIVFLAIIGNKYDHSIKKFFSNDKVTQITQEEDSVTDVIPVISGKSNFLLLETNDNKSNIFYACLIQADCDNLAYKVTVLSPNTKLDGKTMNEIYQGSGIKTLYESVSNNLGIKLDYYVQFTHSSIKDFGGGLGTFLYPSSESLKFSGGEGNDQYALRISEGEQRLDIKDFSDLLRYYVNEKNNYTIPNEIVLYSFVGLINEQNNEKSDKLFRNFISNTITNITVRDYANSTQNVEVFSKNSHDVKVYSCVASYDEEFNLLPEAKGNIQNYYSK